MKFTKAKFFTLLGWLLLCLLLELGLCLCFTLPWAQQIFGGVSAEEILFHLKVPLKGTDFSTIRSFIKHALLPSLFIFIVIVFIFIFLPRYERFVSEKKNPKTSAFFECAFLKCLRGKRSYTFVKLPTWLLTLLTLVLLATQIYQACKIYSVADYIKRQFTSSTWIEEHYVEPSDSLLSWPEEKRNLIYIFLESMESSYASKEDGGAFDSDLIPELTKLAKDNISFSHLDYGIGGAYPVAYTGWTMAAMFAQTTGLPLKIPVQGNSMSEYSSFLPGAVSIGDILEDTGYRNCLLLGSDSVFGGRRNYFESHGNYEIRDYGWALETNLIPEGYHVFWGMEDYYLFEAAKSTLLELANDKQPFNLTMLTVDTHMPDGYRCDLCEYEHDSDYQDALSCSSRQVAKFIEWICEQDFYQNTSIVIVGDHISMSTTLNENLNNYDRRVYNCFINSAVSASSTANRSFTTLDLFPSTLAALGIEIEGERLGLGTNLFSSEPTLTEIFGTEYEDTELENFSSFYNNHFLY